jgi:hypothetical protein
MKKQKFGYESFSLVGIAKNHHQLNALEWKIKKDGFSFRYQFKGGLFWAYKKKKSKIRKHP